MMPSDCHFDWDGSDPASSSDPHVLMPTRDTSNLAMDHATGISQEGTQQPQSAGAEARGTGGSVPHGELPPEAAGRVAGVDLGEGKSIGDARSPPYKKLNTRTCEDQETCADHFMRSCTLAAAPPQGEGRGESPGPDHLSHGGGPQDGLCRRNADDLSCGSTGGHAGDLSRGRTDDVSHGAAADLSRGSTDDPSIGRADKSSRGSTARGPLSTSQSGFHVHHGGMIVGHGRSVKEGSGSLALFDCVGGVPKFPREKSVSKEKGSVQYCESPLCGPVSCDTDENQNVAPGSLSQISIPQSVVPTTTVSKNERCFPTRRGLEEAPERMSDFNVSAASGQVMSGQAPSDIAPEPHVNEAIDSVPLEQAQSGLEPHSSASDPAAGQAQSGLEPHSSGGDANGLSATSELRSPAQPGGFMFGLYCSSEVDDSSPASTSPEPAETDPGLSCEPLSSGEDCDDTLPLLSAVLLESGPPPLSPRPDEPGSSRSNAETRSAGIEHIPDELLLKFFAFLSPLELCRHTAAVCKRWHRLTYDGSLWRRLDVSTWRVSGPQLRQIVLRVPGAIRHLDMSGLESLSEEEMVTVAENCPELTDLDVGFVDEWNGNMMQAVLAHCPKLRFINVEGCRHANNEMMRVVAEVTRPTLRRLNFSHCPIMDESLSLMMKHLPCITHLNIDGISWISEL